MIAYIEFQSARLGFLSLLSVNLPVRPETAGEKKGNIMAKSERINQEKADQIGIKGLLMKPVVKGKLAHIVRQVLDEARM